MNNYGKSLLGWQKLVSPIPLSEFQYLKKNYQFLLDAFPDKETRIVEIWSGMGYLAQFFIINGYKNITLVELSEDFHEAQKNCLKQNEWAVFVNGDGVSYLSKCDGIDVLISRQMAEHLDSEGLISYFRNWISSLNEWGVFVTETINAQNFCYASFLRYIDITHRHSFTTDGFLQLFRLTATDDCSWSFRRVKQLNFFDFLSLRFQKKLPQVCTISCNDNHAGVARGYSLINNVTTVIVRDVIRTISEWLSTTFYYWRAAEAIGSEFIIFNIRKWK